MNHKIRNSNNRSAAGPKTKNRTTYTQNPVNRLNAFSADDVHTKKHLTSSDSGSLKLMFAAADRRLPIDEARKAGTLDLLHREIEAGTNHPLQNKKLLLLNLIHYTDRNLPGIHLLSCIAILLLLGYMGSRDIHAGTDAEIMVLLSMTLPCLLACLSAFEIKQICFAGIAELNKTCYFHARQLAALSMAFSGILNLVAVSAVILLVGLQWKIRLLHVGVYVLVPFILMQCICFGCMLMEIGRKHIWLNAALGIPITLCCVRAAHNQILYTESALFFWAAILLTGIVILVAETKILFVKLEKGDILCTG